MQETLPVVYRKGIPFEFPKEVLERCKLRPNQKVSGRQFWRALATNAAPRTGRATEPIAVVQ